MHRSRLSWILVLATFCFATAPHLHAQGLDETSLLVSAEAEMERAIDGDLPAADEDDDLMSLLGGLDDGAAATEEAVGAADDE